MAKNEIKNKLREIEKKRKQDTFFLNFLKDNFHQRRFRRYEKELFSRPFIYKDSTESIQHNYNMNSYNFFFISFLEHNNLKKEFIKWESKQNTNYSKIFYK